MKTPLSLVEDVIKGCKKYILDTNKSDDAESIYNVCGKTEIIEVDKTKHFFLCPDCKSQAKAYLIAFQMGVEFLNLGKNKIEGKTEDMEFLIRQRLQNLKEAILILQGRK